MELDKLFPGGIGTVQASFNEAGVEIQGSACLRLCYPGLYYPAGVRLRPFPLGNCELYGRGHLLSLLASLSVYRPDPLVVVPGSSFQLVERGFMIRSSLESEIYDNHCRVQKPSRAAKRRRMVAGNRWMAGVGW